MTNPTLIATPFAENGDKNVIPESVGAEPQNATMQAGFPPITQQKISEGGIPPERNDFNGILNLYGQHIVHQNKGLPYEFDQAFADQIGGYPLGAELVLSDGLTKVVNTIPNNTENPNLNMDNWNISDIHIVGSIAELTNLNAKKNKQLVFVSSYYTNSSSGGGLFYADKLDTTSLDNGGTVIVSSDGIRWKRYFSEFLTLDDFGYNDDKSASEISTILKNALTASSNITLYLPKNKTIQVSDIDASGYFVNLVGSNTTIQFTKDLSNIPITLISSKVSGITFDGQNFSLGANHSTYGVMGFASLVADGEYFEMENCTFKNMYGLENNYQYGVSVTASTKSYIRNCSFNNIRTRTNSARTGGFCGGYFIFQPTGLAMSASQHLIENCKFEDIYTMQNSAGLLYDDSDAIRCYFNQYGTGVVGYDDAVKATVIKVQNCTFINVLKSSCKLQHAKVVIDSCYSEVNSLKDQGQTWVYTGFRYQYGENVAITNCEVVGYYRFGCYVAGTNNVVDNLKTKLLVVSGVEQSAVQIGELSGSNVDFCELSNINSTYGIYALGANRLIVRDSKLGKPILGNVVSCKFINCELTHLMDNSILSSYSPSITRLEYNGCRVTYAANTTLMLTITSSVNVALYMQDCKIFGSASLLPTTTYPYSIVDIRNCEFTLSDNTTSTTRRFMVVPSTVTTLNIINVVINDSRSSTPDLVISTNSSSTVTKISGLTFNGSSSNLYTRVMYLTSIAANSIVENCSLKGLPSGVDAITTTNSNLAIRGNGCIYPLAKFVINQTSGTGNYTFIGNYGTLATPHITTSGAGVVNVLEFGTAKW